jgi:ATP-dependent RNA helicase DDX51/DBP6
VFDLTRDMGRSAEAGHPEAASGSGRPDEQGRAGEGGRPEPVLAWMKRNALIAVDDDTAFPVGAVGGLHPKLVEYLSSSGFPTIFSIQKAVWELTHGGLVPLHDICFSAPTGSGKTLAYALPIVNALALRVDRRSIGCVVVLPTRGLAMQVARVFEGLGSAVGLNTVVACGGLDSARESRALRDADVAIFTPGRLVSHIESTHGFYEDKLVGGDDRRRVPFLVVDEADRLLRQRYNDWLEKINVRANVGVKFIVSATLTRDPLKLDVLCLNAPRFVTFVQEENKYKLPKTLTERKIVVGDADKPGALMGLLRMNEGARSIVFVSSVEAAGTLARLLTSDAAEGALGVRVEEYSGRVGKDEREATIERFRTGETAVLVCSDAITRGIDIPNVDLVINYDAPVYAKTYVHRAGRTARAGREGKVVTMLRKEDVRHFKSILRKADNNYVQDEVLGAAWGDEIKAWRGIVEDGLREMARMGAAGAGRARHTDALEGGGGKRRRRAGVEKDELRRKRKAYASMRLPELKLAREQD